MKLKIIFPIIDLRIFVPDETNKTKSPTWPSPIEKKEFIRGYGSIKKFHIGKEKKKEYYCEAKNCFSFIDFQSINEILLPIGFEKFYITKKVFVLKYEKINFNVESFIETTLHLNTSTNPHKTYSPEDITAIIKALLSLKIEFIYYNSKKVNCKFSQFSDFADKIYLRSTTTINDGKPIEKWWVHSGEPFIILENDFAPIYEKKHQIKSHSIEDSTLIISHILIKIGIKSNEKTYNIWEICSNNIDSSNIRIEKSLASKKIIETWVEYEAILSVWRNFYNDKIVISPNTEQSENIQKYINDKISKINQKRKKSAPSVKISDIMSISFYEIFSEDDVDLILNRLSTIRPQILKKIKRFVDKNDSNTTPLKKIKILMLISNPANTAKLNLDKEHSSIVQKLQDRQDQFIINVHKSVNKSEFKELTEAHKPDILHFSGHGESGKYGGIVVQNDDKNGEDMIPPKGLDILFKHFKNKKIELKAVVLNACYSEEQAQTISKHVPFVIGTTQNIKDVLAIAFSDGFYSTLAKSGLDFEEAFNSGIVLASLSGAEETDFVIYKNGEKVTY